MVFLLLVKNPLHQFHTEPTSKNQKPGTLEIVFLPQELKDQVHSGTYKLMDKTLLTFEILG